MSISSPAAPRAWPRSSSDDDSPSLEDRVDNGGGQRGPLDEMNAAHAVSIDSNGVNPAAITGGKPRPLPTMADPVNLHAANHHSGDNRAPTWDSTPFQRNGAETWVSLSPALQLSAQLQVRLGVENLTDPRVIHTDPLNPHH